MSGACHRCKFWNPVSFRGKPIFWHGICKRFPPSVLMLGKSNSLLEWTQPMTVGLAVCGEFKRKPKLPCK